MTGYTFDHKRFIRDCRDATAGRLPDQRIAMKHVAAMTGVSMSMLFFVNQGYNISMRNYLKICAALELDPRSYNQQEAGK